MKKLLLILLSTLLFNFAHAYKLIEEPAGTRLILENDELALFGYGSLMLKSSFAEDLTTQPYTDPFIQCSLKGYKRSWGVHYPNDEEDVFDALDGSEPFTPEYLTYLNIEKAKDSKVNGILAIAHIGEELEKFDYRESQYNQIKINDILEGVTVEGGPAYAYTGKSDSSWHTDSKEPKTSVITWDYLYIVQKALNEQDEAFGADYFNSTRPFSHTDVALAIGYPELAPENLLEDGIVIKDNYYGEFVSPEHVDIGDQKSFTQKCHKAVLWKLMFN